MKTTGRPSARQCSSSAATLASQAGLSRRPRDGSPTPRWTSAITSAGGGGSLMPSTVSSAACGARGLGLVGARPPCGTRGSLGDQPLRLLDQRPRLAHELRGVVAVHVALVPVVDALLPSLGALGPQRASVVAVVLGGLQYLQGALAPLLDLRHELESFQQFPV